MENFDGVSTFISSVGFPIAVAIYLVVVQRKDLSELREAIEKLRLAIILMAYKLDVDVIGEEEQPNVNLMD